MGSRSVARKRSLDESETSSLSEGAEGQKFPKRPWQKEVMLSGCFSCRSSRDLQRSAHDFANQDAGTMPSRDTTGAT